MKQCIRCGEVKDETEFPINRYGDKTYRRNTCRACLAALRKNHLNDNKPNHLTCKRCNEFKPISMFPNNRLCLYGVEPVCKACKHERRREYERLYPERARNTELKHQYGITFEQYREMLSQQDGRCAICGTSKEKLVVDHNHQTGKVRKLLCHLCNALIGYAREDISIIASAISYLERAKHAEIAMDKEHMG